MAKYTMGRKKKRREPRRILASYHPDTRQMLIDEMAYLAEESFYARVIAKVTGFSTSQIYYYCKKLGIKISARRNGEGKVAEKIIRESRGRIQRLMKVAS